MRIDAIRNPEGIWVNVESFRESSIFFRKNGYYTPDPANSNDWYNFWKEERKRCLVGYTSGGAKITGDHYYYLNYCPIRKVEDSQSVLSGKVTDFPDFWDGDYNYFWVREIARDGVLKAFLKGDSPKQDISDLTTKIYSLEDIEKRDAELKHYMDAINLEVKIPTDNLNGGYDIILGKSRRKGYSYKNGSIAAGNYLHRPESYTMFMAYEKKYLYPKGIFNMSKSYINFANQHTAWAMPADYIDRQDHIKASYKEFKNGIMLEKGFLSEIQAISFKDNPDAGRGKDARDIIGEEVGAWGVPGGLKATLSAMKPSVQAGSIKTGMITLFGTSGDVAGGTADFASLHDRPLANGFLPFYDLWGKYPEKQEGFFHPTHWNMEGYYDVQGNSDLKGAEALELRTRESLVKNGATTTELQSRLQEFPLNSSEAFGIISINNFPIIELKAQLDNVKANKLQQIKGTPVHLYYEGQTCKTKRILDGSDGAITSLHDLPTNQEGCVMIYEEPVESPPLGLYKIGYDPVRQDTGTSLAAIIVYKSKHRDSQFHSVIVAEYIGRLETPDDIDNISAMLADLYHTTVMHENEVTGVKNYFRRIKRLGLLAAQPDAVISKNVKNSKVARVYGCHMNGQLKDAGERYVKQWLLTTLDYDENGDPVRVIDKIYSIRLLEELISYSRDGNFDLTSALFMCLFQVQEEALGKEYTSKEDQNSNAKQLLDMMETNYGKKSRGLQRHFN